MSVYKVIRCEYCRYTANLNDCEGWVAVRIGQMKTGVKEGNVVSSPGEVIMVGQEKRLDFCSKDHALQHIRGVLGE